MMQFRLLPARLSSWGRNDRFNFMLSFSFSLILAGKINKYQANKEGCVKRKALINSWLSKNMICAVLPISESIFFCSILKTTLILFSTPDLIFFKMFDAILHWMLVLNHIKKILLFGGVGWMDFDSG